MSVSAVASVGVQAVTRFATLAPVSKAEAVRRVSAVKGGRDGEKRKSGSNAPAMDASRSAAASSSSAVLAVLSELQIGG
jgi:hypothetical protein